MVKLKLLKYKIKFDKINIKYDIDEIYIDILKEDKVKYLVKINDDKETDIFNEESDSGVSKYYYKEDEGKLKRLVGKRNYEYFEVIDKANILKEQKILDKIKNLIKEDILKDINKLETELSLLENVSCIDIFN